MMMSFDVYSFGRPLFVDRDIFSVHRELLMYF